MEEKAKEGESGFNKPKRFEMAVPGAGFRALFTTFLSSLDRVEEREEAYA